MKLTAKWSIEGTILTHSLTYGGRIKLILPARDSFKSCSTFLSEGPSFFSVSLLCDRGISIDTVTEAN